MNPEDLLMQLMGGDAQRQPEMGVGGISLEDPDMIDWDVVRREFGLSDEEVEELQMVAPPEGQSMSDRLQSMRPNMNLGPMELTVDGSIKEPRIEGRMRF